MLQKYKDINFGFVFMDKSRYSLLKRSNPTNCLYSMSLNIPLVSKFYFLFSNVVLIDSFPINRFFLLFWLFSGCFGTVQRYKVDYRLGVYYYHFVLSYKLKHKAFFNLLSFFLNDFLVHHKAKQYKKNIKDNRLCLYFDNLEFFTNYKLARGVYFGRIQQKLFFVIYLDSKSILDKLNLSNEIKKQILYIFLENIKINKY